MGLKITVYVRSEKILTGKTLVEEPYLIKRASRAYPISEEAAHDLYYQAKLKSQYLYVLPEDQEELVEAAQRLSDQQGFELKIIDVSKENGIHRFWRRLKRIKNFPIVESSGGGRLQAPFSQTELEKFISESA